MAKSNRLRVFYDAGTQWGKDNFDQLLRFRSDRQGLERLARRVFDQSGVPERLSVRMYGYYLRNPELAESQFVAGAWDTINGTTDEGVPIVAH